MKFSFQMVAGIVATTDSLQISRIPNGCLDVVPFANIITYLKHRITNATSESINAKIQWVKYTARGFRNKQNFIHAIYFHCGGLDLAPAATK